MDDIPDSKDCSFWVTTLNTAMTRAPIASWVVELL
jgi:hypothetical protein